MDLRNLLVFVLATFCWTKSLLCNVADFHRDAILFRVYTSVMIFKKTMCRIQISQFLCICLDEVVFRPDAHQSATSVRSGHPSVQSIIRLDDENFPFEPSPVSRSFELLSCNAPNLNLQIRKQKPPVST
jgi:hypothetical protein